MDKQIIINTNETGLKLHEEAIDALNFYATFLEQIKSWDDMVDTLINLKKSAGIDYGVNLIDLKNLVSISSVIARALPDLNWIGSQLFLSEIKLQQIFYSKQAYLIVYETLENLQEKQSFLNRVSSEAGEDFYTEFKLLVKQKKEFAKNFKLETAIKNVRNKLAGHIDSDFKLWYQTAISLDIIHTSNILIDHAKLLSSLFLFITKLINHFKLQLDIANTELKVRNLNLLNQLEGLVESVNQNQPDYMKLKIDLDELRKIALKSD